MKASSSAKRIQKELAEISLDPPCNCSAGPKGDNIYEWVSTILGPSGEQQFAVQGRRLLAARTSWNKSVCRLAVRWRGVLSGHPLPA
jgi:hypothetical protein